MKFCWTSVDILLSRISKLNDTNCPCHNNLNEWGSLCVYHQVTVWWCHQGVLAVPLNTLFILGDVACQIAFLWRFPVTLMASGTCSWLAQIKTLSFTKNNWQGCTVFEKIQNELTQVIFPSHQGSDEDNGKRNGLPFSYLHWVKHRSSCSFSGPGLINFLFCRRHWSHNFHDFFNNFFVTGKSNGLWHGVQYLFTANLISIKYQCHKPKGERGQSSFVWKNMRINGHNTKCGWPQ